MLIKKRTIHVKSLRMCVASRELCFLLNQIHEGYTSLDGDRSPPFHIGLAWLILVLVPTHLLHVSHSHSKGRLKTPSSRQHETVAVGNASTIEVALMAIAPTLVVVVASYAGNSDKMTCLRTGAEPVTHLWRDHGATGVDVKDLDAVVSCLEIEGDVAIDPELSSEVGSRGRPVEGIGLDSHSLGLRLHGSQKAG